MSNQKTSLVTVGDWVARRSYRAEQWQPADLVARKDGQRVTVVVPARNEDATIGSITRTICRRLRDDVPLVDELIVVDSRSTDRTAETAAAAGATVVRQDDILPAFPPMDGKGDALWKGLAASTGDVVAFVDGDLRDFSPHFVTGLLGPLLTEPEIGYVKGFYRRHLDIPTGTEADGGGRVTELMARPLLNMFWPQLAGFVQPLAGEYAGRRTVLTRLPFVTDYGVEIGHLIDLLETGGLDALAQVDLGVRHHRHQSTHALGVMSAQILLTVLDRLGRTGRFTGEPVMTLTQFRHVVDGVGVGRELVHHNLSTVERPPLVSVAVTR